MKVKSVFVIWLLLLTLLFKVQEGSPSRRGGNNNNLKRRKVNNNSTEENLGGRERKLFSLFNVVGFRNGPCSSSERLLGGSRVRNGTCFTSQECQDRSGLSRGSCAAGFGVCCVFVLSSPSLPVSQNCSYIQNPGFPSSASSSLSGNGTNSVTYTVSKCSTDVCFLRLDFEMFLIRGPAATNLINEGVCPDTFNIRSSVTRNTPTICGDNSGQHLYIDLGSEPGDTATISFGFSGGTGSNRQWDIKVTQLECSNPARPPNGCLQCHTGLTGRITTFNFTPAASNHLNNQDYNICIRRSAGFCCIRYSLCSATKNAFSLDSGLKGKGAKQDADCATRDYLAIPGSSSICQPGINLATDSRYCGPVFSSRKGSKISTPICDLDALAKNITSTISPQTVPIPSLCPSSLMVSLMDKLEWQQRPTHSHQEVSVWITYKFLVNDEDTVVCKP